MANMQMEKTPMPEQEANVRNANFKEVALGYTLEQAQNAVASRANMYFAMLWTSSFSGLVPLFRSPVLWLWAIRTGTPARRAVPA